MNVSQLLCKRKKKQQPEFRNLCGLVHPVEHSVVFIYCVLLFLGDADVAKWTL